MTTLKAKPLTRAAFAAFGNVVELDGATHFPINQGYAERFHDLAKVDIDSEGGTTCVSVFEGRARPLPLTIRMMERHPLGSQLFYPLQDQPWLVIVCRDPLVAESFEVFTASGRQGINYARNTWHHPLLAEQDGSRFLIVDRKGDGNNLEEAKLDFTLQLS